MKPGLELTDDELVRLMLAGDENAFDVLYDQRQPAVYRFALQMCGSSSVAEDVTQEVFLFLMREGGVFDPSRGSLNGFLLGVARNYVRRRLRDQVLAPLTIDSHEDSPYDRASNDASPLDDITRAETIEKVRKAVLSLPENYREVVVLCELQEMSYVETAEILGCAIGTVRSRLSRARTLLSEKLRPAALEEDASASVQSARCFA